MNTNRITKPRTLSFNRAGAPEALDQLPQWGCWAWESDPKGRPTKVPKSPHSGGNASSTNPAHWGTLEQAIAAMARHGFDGIGFVFLPGGGIFGADNDDGLDAAGRLTESGRAFIRAFPNAYIEPSAGRRGLHAIGFTQLPPHSGTGNKRGPNEVYWAGRFFTFVGRPLAGYETPGDCTDELTAWHAATFPDQSADSRRPVAPAPDLTVADEEILSRARRMAGFPPLFDRGDLSAHGNDHSSADLAELNYLISAGVTDPAQLDRIHRSGSLMRDKWDQRRGELTYGERTIAKALNGHVRPFDGWSTTPLQSPARVKNGAVTLNPQDAALVASDLDPTPCQVRVAELERENAALRAQLAATEERAKTAEAKVALLSEVQSRTAAILRNKGLGQERITAVALSYQLANREAAGDAGENGLHPIPLARIAEAAGVSEDAASKHIGKLAEAGVLKKELRYIPETVDPTTGEIRGGHKRQYIGPTGGNVVDFVTAVAQLDPEKPKNWGGKRTACPDHPEAGTVKKWTIHCAECDRVLERGADPPKPAAEIGTVAGNPQDAEYQSAEHGDPAPSVVTSLRGRNRPSYHNNDLATGTDGQTPPRYDDTGTSVAAAWQRGQPLAGFEPPPPDRWSDAGWGVRR